VEFLLANSIWHESTLTFEQEFLDINTGYFDAQVTPLDFAAPGAAATINGWVSDNTRGKIREIVPDPIPRDIIMYLINAIYFKGDWTYRFDENLTRATPFTLADGSQKTVNMMSHANPVTIAVAEVGDLTVADLPYSGDAYCMTILLPDMPDGLQALVEELTQENWNAWTSVLADDDREVSLPKFTLEYEIKLNDVLTALGMGVAFSAGADFTRVFRPGGIWIDEVKHKTYVDVNEEGTEAAAVTSVAMARGMASRAILVDRPFLFVIREKLSGTILFMGKVVDPTRG
jgi:serpin B